MKKTGKIKAIAGLVVLTLVVGTLAFFSKTMSIDNPFSTKKYGGETVEKFTPKKDWEPGGEVTKEVQAKNTGDYDLWVRVKFDEKWERDGKLIAGTELSSVETKTLDDGSSKNVKSTKFFPTSAKTSVTDGSSVYKHLAGVDDDSWVDGGDGYFYYNTTLKSGDMTSKLLDYVTLCNDANMGTYTVSEMKYAMVKDTVEAKDLTDADYTLDKAPEKIEDGYVLYQKKVVTLDSANAGLAGADYTLTITTELLQANKDAAAESDWATYPGKI